jgi:hypothetical protein
MVYYPISGNLRGMQLVHSPHQFSKITEDIIVITPKVGHQIQLISEHKKIITKKLGYMSRILYLYYMRVRDMKPIIYQFNDLIFIGFRVLKMLGY